MNKTAGSGSNANVLGIMQFLLFHSDLYTRSYGIIVLQNIFSFAIFSDRMVKNIVLELNTLDRIPREQRQDVSDYTRYTPPSRV